mmetsp:Transcript_30711/g.70279  ORF Transcript_30711/g.70279 Transcript_30711/m.70279 type:complete len:304 (-) Transcript_30711:219-1130(-)
MKTYIAQSLPRRFFTLLSIFQLKYDFCVNVAAFSSAAFQPCPLQSFCNQRRSLDNFLNIHNRGLSTLHSELHKKNIFEKYPATRLSTKILSKLKSSSDDDANENRKKTLLETIVTRNLSENWREELQEDELGPLLPLANFIDEVTGGWALTYADLSPETETTPAGISFLATNIGYGVAGVFLSMRGEFLLGYFTDIAGVISFGYHYSQLKFGPNRKEVRLALLFDYITAGSAIIIALFYIIQVGTFTTLPINLLCVIALSLGSLLMSWVYEFGYPYLFWHSLWHIFSAGVAFLVGEYHFNALS